MIRTGYDAVPNLGPVVQQDGFQLRRPRPDGPAPSWLNGPAIGSSGLLAGCAHHVKTDLAREKAGLPRGRPRCSTQFQSGAEREKFPSPPPCCRKRACLADDRAAATWWGRGWVRGLKRVPRGPPLPTSLPDRCRQRLMRGHATTAATIRGKGACWPRDLYRTTRAPPQTPGFSRHDGDVQKGCRVVRVDRLHAGFRDSACYGRHGA